MYAIRSYYATGMDSTAAQVQVVNRCLVIGPARNGAHKHKLVEHELPVVKVAFGERVSGFEILGGDRLASDDGSF